MKKVIIDDTIEITADEGMELFNTDLKVATRQISASKDTDISMWIEREIEE